MAAFVERLQVNKLEIIFSSGLETSIENLTDHSKSMLESDQFLIDKIEA